MTPIETLKRAILDSGLSSSAYAREVLVRDPRSLRRWLAGHSPIPKAVLEYLGCVETTQGQGEQNPNTLERLFDAKPVVSGE